MLQLYIKHKVSFILNKLPLYQVFCHFASCKRTCDSDKEFCQMCFRVYPNCLIDECSLFDEILIDNCFNDKFKAFFLPKCHVYLDIVFLYYKQIDSKKAKFFGCMHHESRTSRQQVFTNFLNVLVRVSINTVMLIYNELQSHPEILSKQLHLFWMKGVLFDYSF